ncbi:MAG: DMT family transporter [Pseudorhodobacter sp.]
MKLDQNRIALAAMVAASALIAMTSLIAKELGLSGLHPFQVSAGRFGFALLVLVVFLRLRPGPGPGFRSDHWGLHIARSAMGWLGATSMFAAAARMPLAEATAITMLSPLVTMALALLLLGESASLRKGLAAALSVIGALVILQPGTEAFHPAAFLALASAMFLGLEAIFIKRLTGVESPLRILLINNSIGAVISGLVASFFWVWPMSNQWILMATLGSVMVCAQVFFLQAMQRGEASLVIPVFYAALVFAAIYDLLFYGVLPSAMTGLGAVLIVAGALLLSTRSGGGRWRLGPGGPVRGNSKPPRS